MSPYLRIGLIVGAPLLLLLAGGSYAYYRLSGELASVRADLAQKLVEADQLKQALATSTQDRMELTEALTAERSRNQSFEDQINKIGSTVGKLDKLSKTDPQLLAKYSKVYFLNENYIPSSLSDIDKKYLFEPSRDFQIHTQVKDYLYEMLDDAADDGVDIKIISAYRSFYTQESLKASYKVTYGAGTANSFSADQGYSEHQLGTALDFTTPSVGSTFVGFDKTDAYDWLVHNAYKYGFVISYPKSNTYYQYEPWHWRYVGVDLATKLHADQQYFYDLDQREINEYLSLIFD